MNANEAAPRMSAAFHPWVLRCLLAGDALFVLLHGISKLLPSPDPLLSLNKDHGYSELFQYFKGCGIVLALAILFVRRREPIYAAWMLVFACLVGDDLLRIHETAGAMLAQVWGIGGAMRWGPQHFGEFIVVAAGGAAVLGLVAQVQRRAAREAAKASKDLLLLLGLLVFFGGFVDLVHVMVRALTVIEEGGELATMSLVAAYLARLLQPHAPSGALWNAARAKLGISRA